jgi:hypothetical protein
VIIHISLGSDPLRSATVRVAAGLELFFLEFQGFEDTDFAYDDDDRGEVLKDRLSQAVCAVRGPTRDPRTRRREGGLLSVDPLGRRGRLNRRPACHVLAISAPRCPVKVPAARDDGHRRDRVRLTAPSSATGGTFHICRGWPRRGTEPSASAKAHGQRAEGRALLVPRDYQSAEIESDFRNSITLIH